MLSLLTAAAPELFFEPANFIENLPCMGIGMLVIFVIIGVIILATTLVGYLFSNQKEKGSLE